MSNKGFFGIGGSGNLYTFSKTNGSYSLSTGDRFYFTLNMDAGTFEIRKNSFTSTVIAKATKSLKGLEVRPTIEVYYPHDTIINLEFP